ncbi:MAG: hypothetical protein KGY39_08175 [Anaerolineales bacterium]|nr:hypothetical protein [Anaerolineales bacterium]
MHTAFQYPKYVLKRKIFSFANKFYVYNPKDEVVFFSHQKMFKLKEDIRVYSDEEKSQELLLIQARQVIDFAASYDVIDATTQVHVGIIRRKGFRSMVRDKWHLLTPSEEELGTIEEDSLGSALLRRFILGSLLPQTYRVQVLGDPVATFRQRFHLLRYILEIDLSENSREKLDPRMGIAAGILLGAIEGRQN